MAVFQKQAERSFLKYLSMRLFDLSICRHLFCALPLQYKQLTVYPGFRIVRDKLRNEGDISPRLRASWIEEALGFETKLELL
jgi:hypothetical protein